MVFIVFSDYEGEFHLTAVEAPSPITAAKKAHNVIHGDDDSFNQYEHYVCLRKDVSWIHTSPPSGPDFKAMNPDLIKIRR